MNIENENVIATPRFPEIIERWCDHCRRDQLMDRSLRFGLECQWCGNSPVASVDFGWFRVSELETKAGAPKSGALVWTYIARTQRVADPMMLQFWGDKNEPPQACQFIPGKFNPTHGWRVAEQAARIYLDAEDMVCRVMKPLVPKTGETK